VNLLKYNKITVGSTTNLIRRSVLEQVGAFSNDLRFGAEWDLWLRMAAVDANVCIIQEPLAFYRRHKQSLSYFPEIDYVDRALADRLVMLNRLLDKYPNKVARKDYIEAVAHQYARAAFASFLLREVEKGRERLKKTVETCPGFWRDKEAFSEHVAVFGISYAIDQESKFSATLCLSFVDLLCANLPDPLNHKSWVRLTKGKVRRDVGYYLYKNGEKNAGMQQLFRCALMAPRLIDLGMMAIFAEAIFGRKFIDRLRSLRHRENSISS
jgi:hypothetical protein